MPEIAILPDDEAVKELKALGFSDGKAALRNLRLLAAGPLAGRIDVIIGLSRRSPSPDGALNNLENIAREATPETLARLASDDEALGRLVTIAGSSPFLSNILARHPEFLEWLFFNGGLLASKTIDDFRTGIKERLAAREGAGMENAMSALRVHRQREMLRIGARDLLGLAEMGEVTRELSDLASASLDAAVGWALEELKKTYGRPLFEDESGAVREAAFTVVGLGKLGGRELNFSSDIDIIYVYSADNGETEGAGGGAPDRSVITLHDFFVRLSTLVTKLISQPTADGFVFRTDLDLRPDGRSGDMANSLRSLEIYYESWGKPWERAAMLKARPVAGDTALGEEFLAMIRPFVYRRHLDFTALEEIKSMKEKIDLSLLRTNPDEVNVKLGAGGIREIEFFCQALQLIHGGRVKEARERGTVAALRALTAAGLVKGAEAAAMRDNYVFLRDLEHRIQIVDGRQTQAVPARAGEIERLARMMGFEDLPEKSAGESFWEEYRARTAAVHDVYRTLFYGEEAAREVPAGVTLLLTPGAGEREMAAALRELGFRDLQAALGAAEVLRSGPKGVRLGARAGLFLQRLGPALIASASKAPDPDRALAGVVRFISAIGARTAFYSLLAENPRTTEELVRIFGTSEFLSRSIVEHPENIEMLLSKELSVPFRTAASFREMFLAAAIDPDKDYEERLDAMRRLRNQELMRIGINDVAGALTLRQVTAQVTGMADACLEAACELALAELTRAHGAPRDPRFAVLGLGKLGGRELIYGSDLDVVFVYGGAGFDERTDGARSISAHEFYVKLGQRIISILTVKTREGSLFSVDARLRPSGSSGPLVVSADSMAAYHAGKTGVWERQAFTRARAVAGDKAFGRAVLERLAAIIYSRPLTGADVDEMLRIRGRMETEIAKEGANRYNIKTGRGGIVDVEFLAQALQLRHAGERPRLRTPATLKALKRMRDEAVITGEDYDVLREGYLFMRALELRMRIVHDRPEGAIVAGSDELTALARRSGYDGPDGPAALVAKYRRRSDAVREIYLRTLEGLKSGPSR